MLRLVDNLPEVPYAVPWRIVPDIDRHLRVENRSAEPADFVRLFVHSGRTVRTERWGQVLPGEAPDVCLCAEDRSDTTVTIAWFRPSTDQEFVWRCTP